MGVAGIMGVVLATHGAAWGLGIGLILYFLIEHRARSVRAVEDEEPIHVEDDMVVEQDDGREEISPATR
jgi:hypothetical protein